MTELPQAAIAIDPVQSARLTAEIVAAYVANHELSRTALTDLIGSVHRALQDIANPAPPPVEEPSPAVSIKKSIKPDYIVCLEDGKQFKSLKRHLRSSYGLSPQQYREKWGLPGDYPMVAPNYAAARAALAKKIGLGHMRNKPLPPPTAKPRARRRKSA
jgi:predicted transcriptional regulator